MNRSFGILPVVCALLALPGVLAAQNSAGVPESAISRINEARARQHVEYLASDAILGRDTPSPGLDSAAEYIVRHFKAFGVEPAGGSYFHNYNLTRDLLRATSLVINDRVFEPKTSFVPHEFSGNGVAEGRFVFVGYGLSQPDSGFDEYAGVDVRASAGRAAAERAESSSRVVRGGRFSRVAGGR